MGYNCDLIIDNPVVACELVGMHVSLSLTSLEDVSTLI